LKTKEEVKKLFHIWKFCQDEGVCSCENHDIENFDVCKRELAWRAYCDARDEYLGSQPNGVKKLDFRDILGLFDNMN
jgi:hypothetical protein